MAKILCVDDEPVSLSRKLEILQRAGHLVVPSDSSEDAILKLSDPGFDAVVTAWRLGSENSYSLLQAAKFGAGVPVIVVSGYVAEALKAYEPFADIYLEKPVNPEELVQIIDALLKSRLSENHFQA